MVFDSLNNSKDYLCLHKNFSIAFEFLERFLSQPLAVGRYEILSDDVFALVQEYEPKAVGRLESHKEYIDIQFIVSGSEKMEVANVKTCKIQEDQTPEKDMVFYADLSGVNTLTLYENDFAIFFPQDMHKPGLTAESELVKKIMIKVRV